MTTECGVSVSISFLEMIENVYSLTDRFELGPANGS